MQKKYLTVAIAAVMVAAAGFVAADMGNAGACDGKTTSVKTAKAYSCTKTAQASACTWTRTASAAKLSAGKSCSSASTASAACCADAKSASYAKSGKASCCAASARQAHYAQVKKIADPVAERDNSRVSMSGTLRCGSCDLEKTDKCQAFIKTAEGRMVPLKHDAKVKGMRKSGAREFEVTGRVRSEGGIEFVEVTNFEAL